MQGANSPKMRERMTISNSGTLHSEIIQGQG